MGNKERDLFTYDFAYGGAIFVHSVPKQCEKDTYKVKAEEEIDSYLKQFFLTKLPDQTLREKAIKQAFAISLMQNKN